MDKLAEAIDRFSLGINIDLQLITNTAYSSLDLDEFLPLIVGKVKGFRLDLPTIDRLATVGPTLYLPLQNPSIHPAASISYHRTQGIHLPPILATSS